MTLSRRTTAAFSAILMVVSHASANDSTSTITLEPAVRERCLEVLRTGMQSLTSEQFWPAIHAAEGLTLGGHGDEVIAFLEPKLATEKDDQHRCGLARELVRAGNRKYAQVMLKILDGEETHGHVHAAESLYKVFEIGDGRAMRQAFAQNENVPQKLMAAAALGRCGSPAAMDFLRESLQHEDADVLRIAAWVLGRIGDTTDIARLKTQLPRCEDPLLKAYVYNSLATLSDADGLRALTNNLSSDDSAIRTYAAVFAGDARAVGTKNRLIEMLDDSYADAAYRAAQSLLVLASDPPADATEDISTLPFLPTKKMPRYTEGSVIECHDGSLLLATTEFHESDSDFAKARIVGRRSTDGGRTWEPAYVLQENTAGLNVMSVTLRRMQSGALGMYYLKKNAYDDLKALLRLSNDEGRTFGEPVITTPDAGYHVVNNDRVTRLSSGRLLIPAATSPDVKKVNHFVSHCYISDDDGATWRNGRGIVDAAKRGAMEPEVIELKDGRVMMLVRTQLGYPGKSYSSDGGDTWSKVTSLGIQAPESPATVRRIPATGDLLLIWNNTYEPDAGHSGRRTPLTAAVSTDEGATWRIVENLESDPDQTYSYVSLIFSRNRALFSYWVNDVDSRRYACRFRSLPVSRFYSQVP